MLTMILSLTSAAAGLSGLGLLALRLGTESRPGFDGRREHERFGVLR